MNFSIFKKLKSQKGFTLIELMVAMSIFIIVLTMTSGSVISIFSANQKSKSLRVIMDNLNTSLEGMTRTIRFGTIYHCGAGDPSVALDCAAGSNNITVTSSDGVKVKYSLSANQIVRTIGGVDNNVTTSDVTITNLKFWVLGSLPYTTPDFLQPKVIIVIQGYAGSASKPSTQSFFSLQTTVSQRIFDFQ